MATARRVLHGAVPWKSTNRADVVGRYKTGSRFNVGDVSGWIRYRHSSSQPSTKNRSRSRFRQCTTAWRLVELLNKKLGNGPIRERKIGDDSQTCIAPIWKVKPLVVFR